MKKIRLTSFQRVGCYMFVIFIFFALLAPALASYSPFAVEGGRYEAPSGEHWLGTNALGQDMFSALAYGARTTLLIGLSVAILSTFLSAAMGLLAGYSRRLDPLLNGIANMLLVLPSLLLVLVVAAFSGGGLWQLVITLGLLTWPGYMRLVRSSVLSLREREFVKAAQLYGGGTAYILRVHLLPFLWPMLQTKFIISFRMGVATEAGLAFLGIGDPSVASWGKLIEQAFSSGETWMSNVWQWTLLPPILMILLVIVSLALMGDRQAGILHANTGRSKLSKNTSAAPANVLTIDSSAATVHGLRVFYQSQPILDNVSFEITAGSVVAIVGESGSGKTTLARALYGLLPSQWVEGEVRLAGKGIYGNRASDLLKVQRWVDAAFIYQDPRGSFHPLLTIGKQLVEAMKTKQSDRSAWQIAIASLKEVGLSEKNMYSYPHQLSGGMLGRAMIALALLNKPKVLIADEPTAALDPIVKREVLDLLIRKVKEYKMTLIMITHDLPAARFYCDRVIQLEKGCLVENEGREWRLEG